MSVNASVNYHVKKTEPQSFKFDVDGIVGNLVSPELVTTQVAVTDVRHSQSPLQFLRDGISFVRHGSSITAFDAEPAWKPQLDAELETLLKQEVGAEEVIVFDHTVRVDAPTADRRPARNVHNDFNRAGAEQRLVDIVGEARAAEFHASGFALLNVWRPIEHTIRSSPLGFIRPDSMAPDDWMDIGLIYPDRYGQILGVAANDAHAWFYKSEMTPEEAVIFSVYDSLGKPYLAHSALDMPGDADVKVPRKSLESRTLVRYAQS